MLVLEQEKISGAQSTSSIKILSAALAVQAFSHFRWQTREV